MAASTNCENENRIANTMNLARILNIVKDDIVRNLAAKFN